MSKTLDVILAYLALSLILLTPIYYLISLLNIFMSIPVEINFLMALALDILIIVKKIRFSYND